MENSGFNKVIRNINEQKGDIGEHLIEKLELKAGKEISLVKRSLSENSAIGVGQKIEGKLTRDVHIGLPIALENANTSPIKEIKEEQGKFFVKTLTSVYELFIQEKQEGDFERISGLQEILRGIEAHMVEQPQSVKDMFYEMKDKFYSTVEIDSKNFMFTQLNGDAVMALVEDEKNPNRYKTRMFRFSGSDHQWKSLPGERDDGSYMKGDEENPLHHYVQSAKLHKSVYETIENLPQKWNHYSSSKYVPAPAGRGSKGRYWEEFEFKENYQTLKNKEWASYQDFCQHFFKGYERFVMGAAGFQDFTLKGGLYQRVQKLESIAEFKNIKEALEKLNDTPEYQQELEKCSLWRMERSNDKIGLKNFAEIYKKNIGSYVEQCFKTHFPETMLPAFSESNCVDTYEKKDIEGSDAIHVEEYKVSSPEGDELIFAMAYDDKGRVYIDNIYDPRVGVTDYGIPEEIVQMGHLVYKPEDYIQQTYAIPEKYLTKHSNAHYIDISALWENIPVIRSFKEELLKRGVLKSAGL